MALAPKIKGFITAFDQLRKGENEATLTNRPKLHHLEDHLLVSAAFFPPRLLSNETQEAANRHVRDIHGVSNFKSLAKNGALKLNGRFAARLLAMDAALQPRNERNDKAILIATGEQATQHSRPLFLKPQDRVTSNDTLRNNLRARVLSVSHTATRPIPA
jgi:hypothetical protein